MEQEILAILQEINPYAEITTASMLLEEDILDSIEIVLLIEELEAKFKIAIPFDSLRKEDFQNIESIVKLVTALL